MTGDSISKYLRRWYILPLALIVAAALIVANEMGYQQSINTGDEMTLATMKRRNLNVLLQQMLDAETGQRGYLLTGQAAYLEPYERASAAINASLDTLRKQYSEGSKSRETLSRLARTLSRRLGEMDVTVKLRRTSVDAQNWLAAVETGVGKELMDSIRELVAELIASANSDIERSELKIRDSLQVSRVGITLAAVLGALAFHLYLRQTKKLAMAADSQTAELAREASRLEGLVRERTSTLADLMTQLQTLQEQERERLAHELHDEMGSLLTAAKLDLARIKASLTPENDTAATRLTHLNTTINEVVALKRRIIEGLRPSSLSNLGLVTTLEILAREHRERSGTEVSVNLESVNLSSDAELAVFRLVQESLTNAAKYAGASKITITLHDYAHHVEVAVSDDGRGFDVATRAGNSHGLTGMHYRIQALKGTLTVKSQPGSGTQIKAAIPKTGLDAASASL